MDNWVVKRAQLTPNKVAVTDGETSYTFREVLEWGCRLGAALDAFGALTFRMPNEYFENRRVAQRAHGGAEGARGTDSALQTGGNDNESGAPDNDTAVEAGSPDNGRREHAGHVAGDLVNAMEQWSRDPKLVTENIAMMANNDIRGYLMAITLMLRGKTVVWLNKRLTDKELLSQMRDAGVRVCLADDDLAQGRFDVDGEPVNPVNGMLADGSLQVLTFARVFAVARAADAAYAVDDKFVGERVPGDVVARVLAAVDPDSQLRGDDGISDQEYAQNHVRTLVGEASGFFVETKPFSRTGMIPQDFADDHVLSVMFTSGSTGRPKGIKQTVRNHFTSATSVALCNGVSPDDEWLCAVPIFHISGYSIILRGLIFGATVRLMGHFDALAMDRILREEPVTWVSVVPTMLKQLVALRDDEGAEDGKGCGREVPADIAGADGVDGADGARQPYYNPAFKGFILGGEKSDVAMLKRCAELDMPVVRSYGMTETCSQIVGTGLADSRDTSRLLSAGKPYFTTQLRLAEGSGEIEIKTGALTSGYIQDDANGAGEAGGDSDGADGSVDVSRETSEAAAGTVQDAGNRSHTNYFAAKLTADGWYRTGDVGHFDTEGYLYVDGRLDNMLISGGEHVFPEEVERVYADCPGIAEIAVTAEPDERWGEVPVAYVVPAEGVADGTDNDGDAEDGIGGVGGFSATTLEALRAFGRVRLAHYKVPHRFYAVDSLPKTSTGKVRRFLLGK